MSYLHLKNVDSVLNTVQEEVASLSRVTVSVQTQTQTQTHSHTDIVTQKFPDPPPHQQMGLNFGEKSGKVQYTAAHSSTQQHKSGYVKHAAWPQSRFESGLAVGQFESTLAVGLRGLEIERISERFEKQRAESKNMHALDDSLTEVEVIYKYVHIVRFISYIYILYNASYSSC